MTSPQLVAASPSSPAPPSPNCPALHAPVHRVVEEAEREADSAPEAPTQDPPADGSATTTARVAKAPQLLRCLRAATKVPAHIPGPPFACPFPGCLKRLKSRGSLYNHYDGHFGHRWECLTCGHTGLARQWMLNHALGCSVPQAGDPPLATRADTDDDDAAGLPTAPVHDAADLPEETTADLPVDDYFSCLRPADRVPPVAGPPFACPSAGCFKVLQSKDGLRKQHQTHGGPLFECGLCGHTTYQRAHMRTHVWTHKDRPSFASVDPIASDRWFKGAPPYRCRTCDKEYDTKGRAYEHERTHFQPEYSCPWCQYQEYSKRAMTQHTQTCARRPASAGSVHNTVAAPTAPSPGGPPAPIRPTRARNRADTLAVPGALDVDVSPPEDSIPTSEPASPPPTEWWSSPDNPQQWDRETAHARLTALAAAAHLSAPDTLPPARPNTTPPFPVFNPMGSPATPSRLRADAWRHALQGYPDPAFVDNIVGMIKHGVKLGYEGPLRGGNRPCPRNHTMDADALASVRASVRQACSLGYTRHRLPGELVTASPIGAVPKKPSGWRMINDLSWPRTGDKHPSTSVNSGTQIPRNWLTYQSIDKLLHDLAGRYGDDTWVWKLDIKDAYRHIAVDSEDARLLSFSLDGDDYVDNCLNFGGRSSPFLFNMFTEALQWILESFGVEDPSHLLDDFFGICDADQGMPLLRFVDAVCGYLGFTVARHKSAAGPCLEILGVLVEATSGTAWLAPQKLTNLRWAVSDALHKRRGTFGEMESLTGSLNHACKILVVGRAFTRTLYDWLGEHRHVHRRTELSLPRAVLDDLRWWKNALAGWPGLSLLRRPAAFSEIWTDAATSGGLGGHLGPPDAPFSTFSAPRPDDMAGADIMTLEAEAVRHALALWGPQLHGHEVTACVDNQAVVNGLLCGRIRHKKTQAVIRRVYSMLITYRISLRVLWISSESNAAADALSRQVFPYDEHLCAHSL